MTMNREEALLQLAVEGGLLNSAELEQLPEMSAEETVDLGKWGPRIQYLIAAGRLTADQIEELAGSEALQKKMSSAASNTFQMDSVNLEAAIASGTPPPPVGPWDRYDILE